MPDFINQQYLQQYTPLDLKLTNVESKGNVILPSAPTGNPLDKPIASPDWVKTDFFNKPVRTRLDETLRYTDPNIGFNPYDSQLEYKYADAHPVQNLRNNVIQFGGRFLGAFAEAIGTIPIAINAAANGKFSKMYDNEFTNSITEWMDTFNTALPVYTSAYEEEHPLLKYLNIFNPKSLINSWGGAINNLGYTAGAITGAIVEDIAITALTGGTGLLPALAANGAQLTKRIGQSSRLIVGGSADVLELATSAYKGGKLGESSLATAQHLIRTGQATAAELRASGRFIAEEGEGFLKGVTNNDQLLNTINKREAILNRANTLYKSRDAVKYQLALLTSASAEGTFEAAEVYKRGKEELNQQFFDAYGRDASSNEELTLIDQTAKGSANFTMGTNIALLYLSNRINWGSLFKPTNKAIEETITGFGKNIARTSAQGELKALEDGTAKAIYSVVNKTPESRIGRILLSGEKIGRIGARSINESIEEGSQYLTSEGSLDYAKHKYDPQNLKYVANFMKSFNTGLDKTFGTNEGWDNMIGGFIGGILGGGVMNAVQNRGRGTKQEQLQKQVELLNRYNFNGFLENRVIENVAQSGLAEDHKAAVTSGDVYKAKNIKFDMLYNWVASGIRANGYEKRIAELDDSLGFDSKSFTSVWGLEDTEQNRASVQTFVDGIKTKAAAIKKQVDKVEYLTKNPHKAGSTDWRAYEAYKDELSLNLSRYNEYQRRVNTVKDELKSVNPLLRVDEAIHITSGQGMTDVLTSLEKSLKNIDEQLAIESFDQTITDSLNNKKQKLTTLYNGLKRIDVNNKVTGDRQRNQSSDTALDIETFKNLFKAFNGIDFENNQYVNSNDNSITDIDNEITDDDLADSIEKLQDIYKLSNANYNIGKYYTYLRKGLGETAYTNKIKELLANAQRHLDENGNIVTEDDMEEVIRQEEYEGVDLDESFFDESGALTPEGKNKREIIKTAARKKANNEELTEEETTVTEENPEVFTAFVQAEQNVKTRKEQVKKEFNQTLDDVLDNTGGSGSRTNYNSQFKGTTPEELFFSLHRNTYIKDLLKNLHNLIFNTKASELEAGLTTEVTVRPKQERKTTPIQNTNGLFRRDFDDVIQVNSDGNAVGEVRPPDSIFYQNEKGEFIPIFDNTGKLTITKEQYATFTGNDINTFDSFKSNSEAYFGAYFNLKNEIANGKTDNATLKKYFKFTINAGSTDINNKNNQAKDVLLKDVNIKNKAVVKLTKNTDIDGVVSYVPTVENNYGLTDQELAQINNPEFLEVFKEIAVSRRGSQKEEIYVAVFPIAGQIVKQSFVRARMLQGKFEANQVNLKVVTPADVFKNFTLNVRPVGAAEATNTTTTSSVTINEDAKLPAELAGAKPRYSYGAEQFTLQFESDIDKAAYIVSQTKKSKRDADYLQFVMDNTGLTADEVRQLGNEVRAKIKAFVKGKSGANIGVDKTYTKDYGKKAEPAPVADIIEDDEYNQFIDKGIVSQERLESIAEKVKTQQQLSPREIEIFSDKTGEINKIIADSITPVEKEVYAKNKKELVALIVKYFKVTEEQAEASVTLFQQQAKAWASLSENLGKKPSDYYKQIGFGGQAAFDANYGANTPDQIQFSVPQATQIQTEVEQLKTDNTAPYDATATNLSEANWYIINTPTFIAWFGDWKNDAKNASKVVDENGHPLVQYHWSGTQTIEEFNLAGIGTHFGTEQAATELNNNRDGGVFTFVDEETGEDYNVTVPREEGKFYQTFLNIKNPLQINDIGQHRLGYYVYEIRDSLQQAGHTITEQELETLEGDNYDGNTTKEVTKLLNKYGYDGFKYINAEEDEGSTSWIAVTKNSIKSVDSRGFNNSSNNIYYQEGTNPLIEANRSKFALLGNATDAEILKFVSYSAQNLDENGKPQAFLEDNTTNLQSTYSRYGKQLVDAAIKAYPNPNTINNPYAFTFLNNDKFLALKGKQVSKETISNLLKQNFLKAYEKEVAQSVLDTMPNKFNFDEFANAINIQVQPLTIEEGNSSDGYRQYGFENIGVKDIKYEKGKDGKFLNLNTGEITDKKEDYSYNVVKLTFQNGTFAAMAGQQFAHYVTKEDQSGKMGNLFGHFRYFVKEGKFYIGEIQSDAYSANIKKKNVISGLNLSFSSMQQKKEYMDRLEQEAEKLKAEIKEEIGENGIHPEDKKNIEKSQKVDSLYEQYRFLDKIEGFENLELDNQLEFYNKFYNRRIFNEAIAFAKSKGYNDVYLVSEETVARIEWNYIEVDEATEVTERRNERADWNLGTEVTFLNSPHIIVAMPNQNVYTENSYYVIPSNDFKRHQDIADVFNKYSDKEERLKQLTGKITEEEYTDIDENTYVGDDGKITVYDVILANTNLNNIEQIAADGRVLSKFQKDILRNVYTDIIKSQENNLKEENVLINNEGSTWFKVDTTAKEFDNILLYQNQQNAKGAYDTMAKIIYGLTNPDVTTFPHELAHAWEQNLTQAERQEVMSWAGGYTIDSLAGAHHVRDKNDKRASIDYETIEEAQAKIKDYNRTWTRETSEAFAKGFEVYLAEGNTTNNKALNSVFAKFALWLAEVYESLKAALGIELNDTMRGIYANMLNSKHVSKEVKDKISTVTQTEEVTEVEEDVSKNTDNVDNLTYVIHQLGEYFVIEDSVGDVEKYGEFETAEAAQAYIDAIPAPTEQTTTEQEIEVEQVAEPIVTSGGQAINRKDVVVANKINEDGGYDITLKGEVIGTMFEQDGEWLDLDAKANSPESFLGDTREEAINALLDKYNETNNLTNLENNPVEQYYTINTKDKDGNKIKVVARLTKADVINEFEDVNGNVYQSAALGKEATQEDYEAQGELIKPEAKYSVNDKVIDNDGVKHTITSVEVNQLPTGGFEIIYNTDNGIIGEDSIKSKVRKEKVEQELDLTKQQKEYNRILDRIAKRFQKLFGDQILFETGFYEWNAPAKFEKGKVLINFAYISDKTGLDPAEIVSHEFMHPFVKALSISNKLLYDNLITELTTNHADIIDAVRANGNYAEENVNDEALVTYLGRELNKAFNKDGTLNSDYVAKRALLQEFLDWLNDIVDTLIGRKKPKTIDQFIKEANNNKAIQVENFKTRIVELYATNEEVSKLFKAEKRATRFITKFAKNKKQVQELLTAEEFETLTTAISNFENDVNNIPQNFEFRIFPTANNTIEFTKQDGKTIVTIDSTLKNYNQSIGGMLLTFGKNNLTEEEFNDFKDVVNNNLYTDYTRQTKATIKQLAVAQINPLLKLEQVSDFILYQISTQENNDEVRALGKKDNLTKAEQAKMAKLAEINAKSGIEIKFDDTEMNAIDTLEAFINLTDTQAAAIRKKILGTTQEGKNTRLESLKDISERRLKSDVLKQQYTRIFFLDKNTADDKEFITEYARQASLSINAAWRKYNEVLSDARDGKGNITRAELNRLNKELSIIRNLIGFHESFEGLVRDSIFNEKDPTDFVNYLKTTSFIGAIKNGMENAAIDLTVEWFTPYANEHNKYIQKEGYTGEEYLLTADKLRNHFKYGVGEDTGFITYWLGSNITSRNPVNAIFANTLSDQISVNNIDTYNDSTDINLGYKNSFLAKNGISQNNVAAQVQFYKDNYMRQADVLQYNRETDKEEYTKKWALHQEFLWDQFDKDLKEFRESLGVARNQDEADVIDQQVEDWKVRQGFTYDKVTGKSTVTSVKYINKQYKALAKDEYFKTISSKYEQSNERYGENKLRYGVVPQKYDGNFLEKLKNLVGNVKTTKNIEEKFTVIKDSLLNKVESRNPANEMLNMDGTAFKTINTNLTKIKGEENLNLNLQETITDFVVESRNYSVLKQTQYNVDTLMLLLEGNTKFNVNKREFSQPNVTARITNEKQVKEAKNKLAKLDKDKASGLTIDQKEYDELEAKIKEGIKAPNIKDRFLNNIIPAKTDRANEMLIAQINDIYFGDAVNDVNLKFLGNLSGAKLAHYLSLYTSINSMAGNVIAATSNISVGNLQLLIEAHGGKYFKKRDLAKAIKDYIISIPSYIQDLQNPIKSKDSQLAVMLDAIQGEIQDEFGARVTGNIAQKMFRLNSLFFMTSVGEHQIQVTNMKAMMYARKVQTKTGETISLYDAFIKDKDGRVILRTDLKDFNEQDLAKFTRDLHGVNRALNGNYSEFNKTMLQRQWYGNLMLKFRKYLYPSFRSRWASEHVDYERNTVEVGYIRYFFGTYLKNGIANFSHKGAWSTKNLKPHEKYALRKSTFELGMFGAITILALAMFGGSDDDKKDLSPAERYLLLSMLRLRADLGMYHIDGPGEMLRQLRTPTASLNTFVNLNKLFVQLANPKEEYKTKGPGYEKGDSKLGYRIKKLVPGRQLYDIFNSKFIDNVDGQLGFMNLVNKNIVGVSPRQSQ